MEIMEMLSDYIVLVVFGICLLVGQIIKTSIPKLDNKYIPLIVGVLGVVINVWYNGWAFTPEILLGGLASGWASTGAYETIKNLMAR